MDMSGPWEAIALLCAVPLSPEAQQGGDGNWRHLAWWRLKAASLSCLPMGTASTMLEKSHTSPQLVAPGESDL